MEFLLDNRFPFGDSPSDLVDLFSLLRWNHKRAAFVSQDQVAGTYKYPRYGNGDVGAIALNAVLSGDHIAPPGKDRIPIFSDTWDIAAYAIDHSTCNAAAGCADGHQIAPDRAVSAPVIVQNDYLARGDIVKKVADGSLFQRRKERSLQ